MLVPHSCLLARLVLGAFLKALPFNSIVHFNTKSLCVGAHNKKALQSLLQKLFHSLSHSLSQDSRNSAFLEKNQLGFSSIKCLFEKKSSAFFFFFWVNKHVSECFFFSIESLFHHIYLKKQAHPIVHPMPPIMK